MTEIDEKEFLTIIEANKDRIYRICRAYCVPPVDAQDLFQEVIVEIWQSLANFKGRSNIKTWIYRITLNVCFRSNKTQKRDNQHIVRLDSIEIAVRDSQSSDEHQYTMLRQCISVLKELERSIIMLHLDELSYREIAAITGITENHVAVKIKRIKVKLLDCIVSSQANSSGEAYVK